MEALGVHLWRVPKQAIRSGSADRALEDQSLNPCEEEDGDGYDEDHAYYRNQGAY